MSEIEKNEAVEQEQNGGIDELVRAAFGEGAVGLDGEIRENGDPSTTQHRDQDETEGFEGLLELMHRETEKRIRREAKDSLMLGGLCGLGVVSLIVAAVTGVWVPVAVGLGVCLSGAAGTLAYRGLVVLRK